MGPVGLGWCSGIFAPVKGIFTQSLHSPFFSKTETSTVLTRTQFLKPTGDLRPLQGVTIGRSFVVESGCWSPLLKTVAGLTRSFL